LCYVLDNKDTIPKRKLEINNDVFSEEEEEDLVWVDIRKKEENTSRTKDSNLTMKLPDFSATVVNGLRQNDSITVWSMMIEQLAHHCLDNYAARLKTSADYKEIGRLMFKKYPCIKR